MHISFNSAHLALLNSKQIYLADLNYLLIQFGWILEFEISEFRPIVNENEKVINLDFLDYLVNFKIDGFIVPFQNLISTGLYMNDSKIIEYLSENKNIWSQIFQAKQISWEIRSIDELFKIKVLASNSYSCVNYCLK